jgi:N-acetyl-anhydromuramyl-L-alanine amidase AmpD
MGMVMKHHWGFGRRRIRLWIVAGAILGASAFAWAQQKTYTVKKNETLSSIARKHGVSVGELAKVNGLDMPDSIRAGQQLRIPGQAVSSPLSARVLKALEQTRVEPGRWKYIVIHHSATDVGNLKDMDRYHREQRHMENGLAYHFLIGNGRGMGDGEVGVGRRWTEQINGGHLAIESLNERSLGICLVGNFQEDRPTGKQLQSLHALVDHLMDACGLGVEAVKTHQQIHTLHTQCPGRLFPSSTFIAELKKRH